jgi:hypothetical protein
MLQTLARCSALTPFDLPVETAPIVANAIANKAVAVDSPHRHCGVGQIVTFCD